jgi:hypothetical protein
MTVVKGHGLVSEGKAHVLPDRECCSGLREASWKLGCSGEGHARCSCGMYGPHQFSGYQRRAWHRDVHKPEALASQEGSR